MLRGLQKASSNWLGKTVMFIVMALITVSFAVWGIGDIFRGFGRSTVAKIGYVEITIDQFRQIYNDKLQQLGRQVGRPVTMDQARALGFDRQIIGQLVAETALDERARVLRLGVSDAEIAKRITSDPSFQGFNGQFDRARFEALLRNAGYTEQRFISEQRRQMLRRQIAGSVIGGTVVPRAAVEATERYQNEQRAVEYVLLDRAQAGEVEAPTPEALTEYFNARKVLFRAPEYRKVVVLSMIPSDLATWIEVSEDDAKKAYEARRSRYLTPERRQIHQIVFANAEEASTAESRLKDGAKFDAIAAERGLSEKDFDLGSLTKASMIDRTIADAAFALKQGEVSAPLQGRFGTVIVQVVKIEPERLRPYEEVADEIKRELGTERAKADMLSLYDKIEDERSIGKTLAQAAETLKLAVRSVEIDRSGRDLSGEPVAKLPAADNLLAAAFSTDPGVEHDPLQVEGGYVWFDVAGITPARERTLDEVKDQVEARWRNDEIANRLKAKAAAILDKLKAGGSLAEVAAADKRKVETKTGIKRGEASTPFGAVAVDTVFRTAKDAAASAEAERPGEQVVFRVTDIVVPTFDANSADAKQIQETLNRTVTDNIFGEYVAQVQNEVGVTINQNAVRQVVTGSTGDDS